eukprot:CAMPEP_0119200436 /NCGR_PEP_ID=MMETSP1316-20130426/25991_1 /TAXON_ID=41880 /ORGANISM="Pycnococcus provasolii, Strain RCC2336" /LENGTH=64 /DNA_ID=CAMNT_0007196491 /DNA_START=53 /DNA_END=247 /DNA_ORIENTATION=+
MHDGSMWRLPLHSIDRHPHQRHSSVPPSRQGVRRRQERGLLQHRRDVCHKLRLALPEMTVAAAS